MKSPLPPLSLGRESSKRALLGVSVFTFQRPTTRSRGPVARAAPLSPERSHSEAGADQVKGSGHGAHLSSTGSIPGGTLRPSTGTPVASGRSCALDGSRQRAPTPPCSGAALSVLREPVAALQDSVAQAGRCCGAMSAASVRPFSPRTEVPDSHSDGDTVRQLTEIAGSYVSWGSLARPCGRPACSRGACATTPPAASAGGHRRSAPGARSAWCGRKTAPTTAPAGAECP